jgi:PAS domain-containing protein
MEVRNMGEEHNLVMILARGMASAIATPWFLVDPDGTLVYYNEAAEHILGQTYAEAGALKQEDWEGAWVQPEDIESGQPLDTRDNPLSRALAEREPAHAVLRITGLDGVKRTIAATAFPLFARTDEFVGAVAIFWEEKKKG